MQHLLVGYILSRLCLLGLLHYLHLSEEDVAHLFGRCYVELFARHFVYPLLQFLHAGGEYLRCFGKRGGVYAHAVHLHFGKYFDQRHLYFVEQFFCSGFFQLRFKNVLEPQCDVGIFRRILVNLRGWEVAHALLVLATRSDEFVNVYGAVVEINFRHVVHVVSQFRLYEIMGYHGVEHFSGEGHSVVAQHLHVILDVLSHFHDFIVFVYRFKYINNSLGFFTIFRNSASIAFVDVVSVSKLRIGLVNKSEKRLFISSSLSTS